MEWKTINKHPEFEVSDLSLVRNKETGKYIKHYPYSGKYGTRIKVYIPKGRNSYSLIDVAKLVAEHFLEKPDKRMVVDFKDGDRFNCTATNLYYRNVMSNKGYFYQTYKDDTYIKEAITEYRKLYPNDYYLEDEDIEQELKMKMYINKEKGVPRTFHFKIHLKVIHNLNKDSNTEKVEFVNYDDYREEINNRHFEDEIERVDDNSYLINKLIHYLETDLTPRESIVLKFRYRLLPNSVYEKIGTQHIQSCGDKYNYTLEETGRYLGITRERVRQIEVKALRKLRHYKRFGKYIIDEK